MCVYTYVLSSYIYIYFKFVNFWHFIYMYICVFKLKADKFETIIDRKNSDVNTSILFVDYIHTFHRLIYARYHRSFSHNARESGM